MTQCGLVQPFWIQVGWVTWHGQPDRQKQFTTERRRCTGQVEAPLEHEGLTFHLCPEHVAEVKAGKLFQWKKPDATEKESEAK